MTPIAGKFVVADRSAQIGLNRVIVQVRLPHPALAAGSQGDRADLAHDGVAGDLPRAAIDGQHERARRRPATIPTSR